MANAALVQRMASRRTLSYGFLGNDDGSEMNLGKKLMASVFAIVGLTIGGVAAAAPAQAAGLACNLNVQYPHGSTHVSGTINVVAVTTCPMMGQIYISVELKRTSPSYGSWTGVGVTKIGTTSAQGNAATNCSAGPGQFQGWATTTIVPPAGYELTGSGTQSKYGTAVSVACGVSLFNEQPEEVNVEIPLQLERVG